MICPKCQTELPEGAKFCLECGHGFKADTSTPRPHPAPEPERKHVTALFSDLTGYTALTERLDPEQVKEITGQVFAGIKQIIDKYEGFIDRLLGDGVLAFFGIPKAHEDDPVRAIQAALEIHDFVKGLSPLYEGHIGPPLSMHSGINTGLVVTAEVDSEKGSQGVTGDAVNLASRLSSLAGPGEILVGEETVRRTRGRFEFQDLGPKRVKGKAAPVSVYKLISGKAVAPASDRQVSSAMVGRDQELNRLELQVMKVINGEGSVVNVVGEAGIGKSRLITELRQGEVMQKVTLLEGRATSIGRNLSFHPLIDLLKQWAMISEEDSEESAFDKLERTIRAIHPEEAEEILPFVATIIGLKLKGKYADRIKGIEGEALEKLIFRNIRELLIKGSERVPTVIVMEDLHWADTSSLLLLKSLYRLAEKNRILFINLFRPGYWQGEDQSMDKIGELLPNHYIELCIQPLDQQAGEALIGNLLLIQGLPHTLRQQIIERSGGNPFFIEEVVRSLIDDGAIIRVGGSFEVTEKIKAVVIPSTINDVLIARIDRLEERTRELVKIASIIGRNFFDRILKEVAASIEDIDNKLACLKDLQLIRDRIRMEELEYFFKHALAQEAAYESTLLQQRKVLHLKVAQSIEKLFQKRLYEFYGLLAFHYSQAGDLEKAEEWMTIAGEEALRTSASSEALHYYQEALRLYQDKSGQAADPDKLAYFEKNIATALFNKSQWVEALKYIERVLDRWGAPIPKKGPAAMARFIGNFLVVIKALYVGQHRSRKAPDERDNEIGFLQNRAVAALFHIDSLRAFISSMNSMRRVIKTGNLISPDGTNWWMGLSGLFSVGGISFSLSKRMMEVGQRLKAVESIGGRIQYVLISTINDHIQGAWDKIKVLDEDLLDASLKMGDLFNSGNYLWFSGLVRLEQGDFNEVRRTISILFELGEAYDSRAHTLGVHHLKADFLIITRAREALAEAEQCFLYSCEKSTELHVLTSLGRKAEALILLDDHEGAEESLSQAKAYYEKQKLRPPIYAVPYLAARFLADIHQLEMTIRSEISSNRAHFRKQAYQDGKAAVRKSRKYAPYRTKIFRLMGLYYWLIGKQRKALTWWTRTIQEGERLGARPDLARTFFEVGKRLLEPHSKYKELNGISVKEYFDKAEKLFREMDLQWDLEQLERVAGRG